MNKLVIVCVCSIAAALPLSAQTDAPSLNKPLTESEFSSTIDSIGQGDPTTKAPLSVGSKTGTSEPRKDEKKPRSTKGATEITARDAAFDQKTHQAVFAGAVVVKNPEFNITCDKLTAYLRQGEKNGAAATKPPANGGSAPAPGTPKTGKGANTGGLEKAIAEGSVVITQEKEDTEGRTTKNVGKARRAVYEANSGDITLTGRPEVQQGINTCIALDDSTVMILNREGRMRVIGPHKTVIKDTADANSLTNAR